MELRSTSIQFEKMFKKDSTAEKPKVKLINLLMMPKKILSNEQTGNNLKNSN